MGGGGGGGGGDTCCFFFLRKMSVLWSLAGVKMFGMELVSCDKVCCAGPGIGRSYKARGVYIGNDFMYRSISQHLRF